jgi:predicted transcriptional regulator
MIDETRMILISVRPRFARAIVQGDKTVELRRTPPRIEVPTRALIYASSPERALVGMCDITRVLDYTPIGLWRQVGPRSAVTFDEFCAYFEGSSRAYGLVLEHAVPLEARISLSSIRDRWHGFQPPQSFRYLSRDDGDEVLALAS